MEGNLEILLQEAQNIMNSIPNFFRKNGPGEGNLITNDFMNKIRERMLLNSSEDYSEKKICNDNKFAVDFYFPKESTIVEIALGLRSPNSEYEKDILKAIIAKENGLPVNRLIFISKIGAKKKCNQPARKNLKDWLKRCHNIQIDIWELFDRK